MIEGLDKENIKITGYALPKSLSAFEEGEIWNAFLAQSMMDPKFEDRDREVLTRFLGEQTWLSKESKSSEKAKACSKENSLRSVYKYLPVALKVKLVIQELPAEFRIKREIVGDPLAEMPKLSTNPSDFIETGRYTLEHKEKMDKVHSGEFLLSEERKLMHHFMMLQSYGLLHLPIVQMTLTINRHIQCPSSGSKTLKNASRTCIVLRSSEKFRRKQ